VLITVNRENFVHTLFCEKTVVGMIHVVLNCEQPIGMNVAHIARNSDKSFVFANEINHKYM